MRTDLLDGYCARFRPKLIYTVPTFQNPTGTTLPPERRSELIDVARRYQCLIVEDDAYGDLWYGGESSDAHRPIPLKGMENAGYVMYLSTFSKTVTSGLRTGWVVADPHVINRLAALRRMVDQHTSTSSQRICLELLKEGRVAEHLRGLIKLTAFDEMQQSQHWSGMRRMKCIGPCLQAATIFGFPYRTACALWMYWNPAVPKASRSCRAACSTLTKWMIPTSVSTLCARMLLTLIPAFESLARR